MKISSTLVAALIIAVCSVALFSCNSKQQAWTQQNIDALTATIVPLNNGGFIADMTEDEYGMYQECILTKVMQKFPNYAQFDTLKSKQDTIYEVTIDCTADFLGEDYKNLRRLFPYKSLVQAGILPDDMDREKRDQFYVDLANLINDSYPTSYEFVQALAGDTSAVRVLNDMMIQCAAQAQGSSPATNNANCPQGDNSCNKNK